MTGQTGLRYRYFEADSGVIGDEFTAGSSVNFSNIAGMFLAGNTLYYADKANGNLHAVAWNNGAPDASTDTVVSGPGLDGNDWRARGLFALPSPPPVAAFTSSCDQLSCSFDASASTAPGGTVTGYSWDFGDGHTDTGVTPTHVYDAAGSDSVTLTVTSSLGTTASVSHIVQPFVTVPSSISFVDASHVTGNSATMTVNVPATVQTGDGLLLMISVANAPAITPPSGWTLVGTSPGTQTAITTQVYKRVATGTDAGTAVSVGFAGTPHSTLEIVAYRGVSANFVATSAVSSVASGTTINSPTASTSTTATWVVTFYSAKSSAVTGWTVGGAQTTRDVDNGTGSGRTNSIVVDSGSAVPVGSVGNITGTTDLAFGGATAWTIVIQ
jgi:PKD repeat protein